VSAQQLPPEAADASHWIRELTLKAKVPTNLNNTFRLVKELRKRVVARAKEAADLADVIVQEQLQVIRTGKIHRLRDVNVRPNVGGKKAPGTLEIHSTGLRFQALHLTLALTLTQPYPQP
jgi:nucleosome binding factor SPN SPT16 subunit